MGVYHWWNTIIGFFDTDFAKQGETSGMDDSADRNSDRGICLYQYDTEFVDFGRVEYDAEYDVVVDGVEKIK